MNRVFLYPLKSRTSGSPNPYLYKFQESIKGDYYIVNENMSNKGIINLFLCFFKTDIFFLNWIEFLGEKKFGRIQIFGFTVFIWLSSLFRKKIVWILHNKGSHHSENNKMTDYMFRLLMRRADRIITHSESGLEFVRENYPNAEYKVKVIIHPVGEMFDNPLNTIKKYDFLIWGTLFPYKGIDKFLQYIKNDPSLHHFKILIVGMCPDKDYKNKILKLMWDNVTFYDEYFELHEIANFSSMCKFTLFTYDSKTVISSGVLIDAIRMNSIVIGPNHGAFRDLGNRYNFVKTYDDLNDLVEIVKVTSENTHFVNEERAEFCKANSWPLFIHKLQKAIS